VRGAEQVDEVAEPVRALIERRIDFAYQLLDVAQVERPATDLSGGQNRSQLTDRVERRAGHWRPHTGCRLRWSWSNRGGFRSRRFVRDDLTVVSREGRRGGWSGTLRRAHQPAAPGLL